MTKTIQLGASPLSLNQVIAIAKDKQQVAIAPQTRQKLQATRDMIEANWMHDEAPLIYSFNTGVGVFKNTRIAMADIEQFQRNLIYAHATGLGPDLPAVIVRAIMLLRLNAFMSDYSGVSLVVADRLVDCLNHDLIPAVPAQGSVGASGDLAPLAHMAGAICGFEEAFMLDPSDGSRQPARQVLKQAGLDADLNMEAKDASALINGSTVSLAIALLALVEADNLVRHADIGLALSLEAMRCEKDAFIPEIHEARPHPGQQLVARNVLRLVGNSQRMSEPGRNLVYPAQTTSALRPPRVQDSYSLRCAPQVHGPAREALDYVRTIVEREINSATDNPLIVTENGERRAVSGGHFHGQYIAQAMDLLAIAITDLSSICERRVARLIDPIMSDGLGRNLASGQPGLNTGYATVQCSLSALVMENRTLSTPGSMDSIPGKGNAEDHVSNSTWCARKAAGVVNNGRMVIAGEILIAGQALSSVSEIAHELPMGDGSHAALQALRKTIEFRNDGDVWYANDMQAAASLVDRGDLLRACAEAVGRLE